jgi:hypothetical protein
VRYVKHDPMAPCPREHPTFKAAKRKLSKAAKQAPFQGVKVKRPRKQ